MQRLIFLHQEIRNRFTSGGPLLALGFFVIAAALLPLGIGPNAALLTRVGIGMIWVLAALAMLLSLDRLFAGDAEEGALELYLLSGLSLESIAAAKIFAHWLTTGVPLILLTTILSLFYALPARAVLPLMASLALGTPAISAAGAIGASLTLGLSRGGLLMPLLILPLIVPVVIFGCSAAAAGAISAWYLLAAVTVLALLLSPFAVAAAIRLYLAQ